MSNQPKPSAALESFESLASEFAELVRSGKSPEISEFADRNGELASQIQRLFPVLEMLERNGVSDVWSEQNLLAEEQRAHGPDSEKWPVPHRLGDFRLIREIGRGGMGVVYEAEQESLGRRVAIKILPTSAQFDQRRMERFATEAKASAMLHHTNIVPVFGIGREGELSFFVMQYIHGQPLDLILKDVAKIRDHSTKKLLAANGGTHEMARSLFDEPILCGVQISTEQEPQDLSCPAEQAQTTCDESPVSSHGEAKPGPDSGQTRSSSSSDTGSLLGKETGSNNVSKVRSYFRNVARVGVKVSEALEHAHNHGILHRDIKPSNLLLDEHGAVWVTDFGVAKYFESPDITRTGEVVGTLRYMSPEQLNGNASLQSDIFGLGITLYEMLTLQPAYPGSDRKRLLEKVAQANLPTPRALDSRIPRDLETIVMKCVHADPGKRYATAAEVGEDLTRFLDGQPIHARRISLAEKAWKWCCRRPMLAAALTALAASIVLGAMGVGWQWQQTSKALTVSEANFDAAKQATIRAEENSAKAKEHFEQARSAVVQITESISNEELLTQPDLLPVRRKLLRKALEFQIEFVKSHPGNNDVEIELATSWLNLAAASSEVSQTQVAKQCLEESRAILDRLRKQDLSPKDRERVVICLAENYSLDGKIAIRDSPDGQSRMFKAVRVLMDGRSENQLSDSELITLAELHRNIGDAYTDQNIGRPHPIRSLTQDALTSYTQSFELTQRVAATKPENRQFARMLAGDHRSLGMANRRLGELELALKHYTASVDQFRDLVAVEPENTDFRFGLAEALSSLAFYYTYGENDTETALANYHKSIEEYSKLSKAYPSVLKFVFAETKTTMNCCQLYERVKRSSEATALRERTIELARKALLFSPDDPKLLSSYGKALGGLGINCTRRGEHDQAWDYHLQSREQHEKAVAIAPQNPTYRIRLCGEVINISYILRSRGEFRDARLLLLESTADKNPDSDVMYLTGRALLALAQRIHEQAPDVAESDLAEADQAMTSAKEIFRMFVGPKLGTRERMKRDKKLTKFLNSELGASFMEWFAGAQAEFTQRRGSKKVR